MAQATKRIRLEQRVMPVSSEEELSLVTLREQNKKLSNNYGHRLKVEQDLRKKIEQLEETLRLCEEKEPENQLTVVNDDLRSRVEDLEFELNKSRLNEQRLADDLDHINNEFAELRKRTLQTNPADSIRHHNSTSVVNQNCSNIGDQHNQSIPSPGGTGTASLKSANSVAGVNSLNSGGNNGGPASGDTLSATIEDNLMLHQVKAIHDLNIKLDDQTELASNRLKELEQLNEQHKEALLIIDRFKHEAKCIPKETIIESAEYKTLQSHFSVLYNEATQLKIQLIESKQLMIDMKNDHIRQVDRMEADEQRIQRELRTNVIELEMCLNQARDQVAEIRRENDRLDKANESTLKLDTELKKSLNNFKIQVAQKNNELQRLKRKVDELKRAQNENHSHHNDTTAASADNKGPNHANAHNNGENLSNNLTNHSSSATTKNSNNDLANTVPPIRLPSRNSSSSSIPNNSINSSNHSPSSKKIMELKEVVHQLQKQLDKAKSEEDALMQELDVTGQAYEDMQDQNHRLLQQIEEKDEANFKLMSEHLKNNALQKHLNDEKMKLEELGKCLRLKIEHLEKHLEQMEEHMKLNQSHSSALENEMALQKRLNDEYKKEKLELSQQLAEINSEKEKITNQLDSIQRNFNERTSSLSHESFKNKRLLEELESIKKKYERASSLQSATSPDEVLMEEIREYKEQLTCPSCKTKPKDAVLTKCFHVFCFDCLKTRVDTRQRKCPKCNAQFGANDFHRLYLV